MATIRVTKFGGLLPSQDRSMLPDNSAQVAINCRLTSGTLDSYQAPVEVYNPYSYNIKTIYRFDQASLDDTKYWFTFSQDVDVVKGAISGDVQERTYWTGDGYPKVTDAAIATSAAPYPSNSYRLGVEPPTIAPVTVPVSSPTTLPTALSETRLYVYTFVTAWGEESAPSPVSLPLEMKSGDAVTLMAMQTTPNGNHNVVAKRIYRTSVGSVDTNFLFVAEISTAANSFTDDTAADALGEVIPTAESGILPENAKGLTSMANGIMAAFSEYDVYICEAFKPHSWPSSNMQAVDFPVVGLKAFGSSLVILTSGNPYILTGTDPQAMTLEKLAVPYSCASKRSICAAFGNVIYASPDGLISIGANGVQVLTEDIMTRLEWQKYNPSSMMCAVWDDRVFMFYDNGTTQGCLTLDNKQGLVETDVYATAVYNDNVTGSLYLAISNKIVKWNAGDKLTYTWKSKQYTHPNYVNFAWGQVLATSYPVTLRVYGEDELRAERVVTSTKPFRLPSGFKCRYWELELTGTNPVIQALVSETMEELKNV